MKREKNYNLEVLRVVSCIMVVVIHVANYYSRGYGLGEVNNASYIFSIICNVGSRIAVPIFFMISGSLLVDETLLIKKSLRRVGNTLWSLVVWSAIYYIWNYFYRDRLYDFRLIFAEPVKAHLWFLYAIIGMYLVLPFLQNMFKNMQDILMRYFAALWFLFLTIEYVLALCELPVSYNIPLVGNSCYLGYFVLGYIVKGTIKKVPISTKTCYVGAVLCLATVIIFTYICTVLQGSHYDRLFQYRNILIAIPSALIFYDALKNEHRPYKEKTKKVLSFLSRHSFNIYLCHVIFLDIVKLEFAPRSISAFIGIPLYTLFVFGCSLLFSVIWQFLCNKLKAIIANKEMAE